MKLESLKETKFKDSTLKREQMAILNGGLADAGTATPGGKGCKTDEYGRNWTFDYGYDAQRADGISLHNRTNWVQTSEACTGTPAIG